MIRTHGVTHFDPHGCFGCKLSTLSFGRPDFEPHFNWSVGQYVRNDREYRDALKRCQEENSVRTGTDHRYEARDMRDIEPFHSPEAELALEDRAKVLHDGTTKHLIQRQQEEVMRCDPDSG